MAKGFLNETNDDFKYISFVYKNLGESAEKGLRVAAASEWLLDNYYIIERQYKDIKSSFTNRVAARLPIEGKDIRVLRYAKQLIEKSSGRIDEDYIINSVLAKENETSFTTEEIWAFPIMLKAAVFKKLRQVCERIYSSQCSYKTAEEMYARLTKGESLEILKKCVNSSGLIDNSLIEYLVYRLKSNGSKNINILSGVDKLLENMETSVAKAVEEEYEKQARRQMSMGNHITNLSVISSIDWTTAFERLSLLEKILRNDPSGIYEKMDFESRNYYRDITASIGRKIEKPDTFVAEKALSLSQNALNDAERHIGYYLLDKGKKKLYEELNIEKILPRKKDKTRLYISSIIILSIVFSFAFTFKAPLAFLLLILPVSGIAVNLVNYILSYAATPAMLPKLEIGSLEDCKTLVVIPTLITSKNRAKEIFFDLETYYLANRVKGISFALLADLKEADSEIMPEDEAIDSYTEEIAKRLNEKYEDDIFYYLRRKRVYNKMQKKWMGWERKRGALLELSKLLTGDKTTSYITKSIPGAIKYVITLDADTKLSIGAAAKMVGTMLHPLNKPVFNKEKNIVESGYGILQPRVSVDIESANKTFFSRVFAGQGGIDPYSTVISDIYQDYFGESIFTGKGIFEVEIYTKVLKDAFPENSVLSHDLIEGAHLHCGLLGDVELIDGYPHRYNVYADRQHRWIRGDWQLIFWLFGRVKNSKGKKIVNPLSTISKWKIFDNLRRSLVPIGQLLLLSYGLCVPKGWPYIVISLVSVFFGVLTYLLDYIIQKNYKYRGQKQYVTVIAGLKGSFFQASLLFAFLAHQAFLCFDAILRTLYRSLISRKNMLQWITAADAEKSLGNSLTGYIYKMIFAPLFSVVLLFFVLKLNTDYAPLATAFAVIWFLSPYIAYSVSNAKENDISAGVLKDRALLREWARRTYAYFEDFMLEKTGFIPPDNYQEHPRNGAANRTSPTNIGVSLLALICAYDLGYITKIQLVELCEKILSTIEKLPKWNGHLYNWYDTKKFDILKPAYISTVDSGNLCGYLIVLAEGLCEAAKKDFLNDSLIEGIKDTAEILKEKNIYLDTGDLERLKENKDPEDWVLAMQGLLSSLEKNYKSTRWAERLRNQVKAVIKEIELSFDLKKYNEKCKSLADTAVKMALDMDFKHLYNPKLGLFSIGYNLDEGKITNSYYDLLASEARQASLIAIAKGDVSAKHWFKLGRSLAVSDGYKGLASWSGTMFEYFMPRLIIRNIENTLLDETYKFVADTQMKYGRKRSVPFGVSESGFAAFDMQLNYQYKAFGVPELGFKRGLAEDTVIAPYASMLALMEVPKNAIANLKRLTELGAKGEYGFYEAVDYTPERQLRGQNYTIVKSYMVHHNGMSLASLVNVLENNILQKRFHKFPMIRSAEYLLGERVPQSVIITESNQKTKAMKKVDFAYESCCRVLEKPREKLPLVHILSNSTFSTMIDDRGRGYSKNNHVMLTAWRGENPEGMFFFLKNVTSGEYYSITPDPCGAPDCEYKGVFASHKAEYTSVKDNITSVLEVGVSPKDSLEVRRVTLRNTGDTEQLLELTSYMEPVLLTQQEDCSHPAFGKLFMKTEFLSSHNALLCVRRPRTEKSGEIWAFHRIIFPDCEIANLSFETDRARFIGRGRDISYPLAMDGMNPLSCRTGAPIDPIMAIRGRVLLKPGMQVHISFISGSCFDKEEAISLISKFNTDQNVLDVFELALTRSRVVNKYINLKADDEEFIYELLAHMVYTSHLRRREHKIIEENTLGQKKLWEFGVSGDLPILLVIATKNEDKEILEKLLKAHEYWRLRGFACDMVVICDESGGGYLRPVEQKLKELVSCSHARELENKPGGVFLINAKAVGEDGIGAFVSAARIVVRDETIKHIMPSVKNETKSKKQIKKIQRHFDEKELPFIDINFNNGIGGFSKDGREYIISLSPENLPPLPWINTVANEKFGFLISELGGGYVYSKNSRENRITKWSNDFVADKSGENILIYDSDDGMVSNITVNKSARVRHGFGYSVFEGSLRGIYYESTHFVPLCESVKITRVKLENTSSIQRNIKLIYHIVPVVGGIEYSNLPYINTCFNGGILMAANYTGQNEFSESAFIAMNCAVSMHSGNNLDFEKGGIFESEGKLSGETGGGFRQCMALMTEISLKPGEAKDIILLLGAMQNKDEASAIKMKYQEINAVNAALTEVKGYWDSILSKIKITSPDDSFDVMMNGWLLYQTYTCRMLARSGFYQSGGAYGYRDQLQDCSALLHTLPKAAEKQILLCCSHQFLEGDVMHWWHPDPVSDEKSPGKGVRTKFSDDLVWLVYVVAEYVKITGNYYFLDTETPYISENLLKEDEDEKYISPWYSDKKDSVYRHCLKAMDRALKFGEHGLPLMGSGDWNDGMNTVGNKGKGESVWLGFFIYHTIKEFLPIMEKKGDTKKADEYRTVMKEIEKAADLHGWDGNWYRRAYYDDGRPIGTCSSAECRIDSISQSWAIISGAAPREKALEALKSAKTYLVRPQEGIVLLLNPPFDGKEGNPGYIKGYLPGVRENGGQYTHAAVWLSVAFALAGAGDDAMGIFSMINPVNHTRTPIETGIYKAEPYSVAADIYAADGNTGRGGWSWYTGAAGWMYRSGLEYILGINKRGGFMEFSPCIPAGWKEFSLEYAHGNSKYVINVKNPENKCMGISSLSLDNVLVQGSTIPLEDDGRTHKVDVIM